MPIDPTSTAPGLASAPPEQETVHMKCRGGLSGKCESMKATIIKIPGHDNQRLYRCVACGHSWGINVGGFVNL